MLWLLIIPGLLLLALVVIFVLDVTQRSEAIRRNFPVVGRLRFLLSALGPELRQYIVASNDEERPFNRDQRHWVDASSKKENNYFGFGTDSNQREPGFVLIRHSAFPDTTMIDEDASLPCAKVLGGFNQRTHAFRPRSIINISAMSYGSLSNAAIRALNEGSALAGCLHNTGEGGISSHHRHGGELMFQFGTGYFGCRDEAGNFSMDSLLASIADTPVRAIEVKLSQGAKPGLGGMLPAAKVTPEIAQTRGIPVNRDCASPASHTAFGDVDSMIDFIEEIAIATGLPVGIKSAVGQMGFWNELADRMEERGQGPDFITIDGGEGGTGAAPLTFSDHVALPFRLAFSEVFAVFAKRDLAERVVWIGSGKLGFGSEALLAMTLGVDMIAIGREAMLAIGCIQAQKCHTGHCPTGVATHTPWLVRGLDVSNKSARLANYIITLRAELLKLAHACGVAHPSEVPVDAVEIVVDSNHVESAQEHFGYDLAWQDASLR